MGEQRRRKPPGGLGRGFQVEGVRAAPASPALGMGEGGDPTAGRRAVVCEGPGARQTGPQATAKAWDWTSEVVDPQEGPEQVGRWRLCRDPVAGVCRAEAGVEAGQGSRLPLIQARGCGLGQAGGSGHKEKELKSAATSRVELRVG